MALTAKQTEGNTVLSSAIAIWVMLFGGSRSGKTYLIVRAIVMRALKAPKSRHAILRFRFNAVKQSVIMDTFLKVMANEFPGVEYHLNKSDWFVTFGNDSEIWFGGLDDKERTEKILGMEFVTIYINEASQVPWSSVMVAMTRLAQKVYQNVGGVVKLLKPRMYADCNPTSKAHWSYRLFIEKRDPETKVNVPNPGEYASLQMNPESNKENLSPGYLDLLKTQSARLQKRFLKGEFSEATPNALWVDSTIDKWRVIDGQELPDFLRVIVAVDPSGADEENPNNDAIGIMVVALGMNGIGYVLEDLTVSAGPATWGRVVTNAYERHNADLVVGEVNYGGAMVKFVVQTARAGTPFKMVTASRGKAVRAEPISALYEDGRVRHVGEFNELEDEMCAFSTAGYLGENSPNRADALVWGLTEIFPGVVKPREKKVVGPGDSKANTPRVVSRGPSSQGSNWMRR